MTEQSWQALFRTPKSTVTKVLKSPAFAESRTQASAILDDPVALRRLADVVEAVDQSDAPLSAVSDRVAAAVRFLRAEADRRDKYAATATSGDPAAPAPPVPGPSTAAGRAARERLIVAALHYLVTPVDLVPDFRVGGYIDDVLLLSWVFGAAVNELSPYLDEDPTD